jgi:hypothetical protein
MHSKPTYSLIGDIAIASTGAAIVTMMAIAQGQNPCLALGVTLCAAIAAAILNRTLFSP